MSKFGAELKKLGLMSMYTFLDRNPEKNLPKLMNWLDTYISPELLQPQREFFRNVIDQKDSNWYQLIVSVWSDIDAGMRRALFENIVINANANAAGRAQQNRDEHQCNIPWVIGIELGNEAGNLDFDKWDDVIEQAKSLGTFAFLFQGGEPLDYKEEIIALCNKHNECEFMMFTDGLQMDEEFAMQVLRVKNLIPAIKISSLEDFNAAKPALEIMRTNKLPYAASVYYSENNAADFAEEKFFDELVEAGVKLALFLSTTGDDDAVYDSIKKFRENKKLCTINFCKDKGIIGGCVAGGKYYCHINANGNVEPCFFVSMSDSNLKECSLLEAYKAPLFKSYYGNQSCCMMEILKKNGYMKS